MSGMSDPISRQMIYLDDAIDAIKKSRFLVDAMEKVIKLPSVQPERDIPKKPNETIDRTWGIPHRQAVCPNCDRYIGTMYFLGEGKRKISYCDSCGQAIDWSDWRYEDE